MLTLPLVSKEAFTQNHAVRSFLIKLSWFFSGQFTFYFSFGDSITFIKKCLGVYVWGVKRKVLVIKYENKAIFSMSLLHKGNWE